MVSRLFSSNLLDIKIHLKKNYTYNPFHIHNGLYFLITACFTCDYYDFQCNNGQCVYFWDRCDGILNCNDGSDEDDCGKPSYINSHLFNDQIYIDSHRMISKSIF